MLNLARTSRPPPPRNDLDVPEYSSGHVLTLDEIESATLRQAVEHWSSLRGERKFPARADVAPKNFKNLLRHVMLVRVIDGGADYEFHILGDVHYGENFRGMRLSDVGVRHPKFGEALKVFYDGVRMGREAFGYRVWIGRDMPDTRYSFHELVLCPLGPSDDAVATSS